MNEKEGLNLLDFLASGINKNDPVIQAVLSNYEGEGAIANEIEKLIEFINFYTRTDDVKNHEGESLEIVAKLFTGLRRQLEEDDNRLLRRMRALTERKGDVIWGNARNIKNVLEMYFADIKAFVCENTNKESLLFNGDFETDENWRLEGNASYEYEARFLGKRGLFFNGSAGVCTQNIAQKFESGVYTFHFFLKGKCGLVIKNEAGQYWNADERILAWQVEEFVNYYSRPDWENVFCFVVLPESARELEIQAVGLEGEEACIDYARLFVKPLNPSYTIIVQNEGYVMEEETMHLGKGSEDPHPGVVYAKESLYDHAYIAGPKGAPWSEVYKNILEAVRPRGIQVFMEFAEKVLLDES
jgi:hypothetical protein